MFTRVLLLLSVSTVKSEGEKNPSAGKSMRTDVREKRRKIVSEEQFEDIPMETVAEVIATIDGPSYKSGSDVR